MSKASLFRSEALEAKRGEWLGSILIAAPVSRWVWAFLAISFATALLLFLTLGRYTRREAVSGQLVPTAGLLNLSASGAGLVARVWVHDGQKVKLGEPLIEISSEQNSVALGDMHTLVSQQMHSRAKRLHKAWR